MCRQEILNKITGNSNLLSLPQVLSDLIEEVSKDDFSADNLANIILRDPSLTSRILRVSNSTYYNRYAEIKTVQQAISMMGMNTVKCLALSTSIFHPEKITEETGINCKEYFGYVLSIAAACKRIGEEIAFPSTEEAFIAGLLHDIGLLFLLHNYPKKYKTILTDTKKSGSLEENELEVFGITHSEISKLLLKEWRIPNEIIDAVTNHHSTSVFDQLSQLNLIVRLAIMITKDRFSGYHDNLEERLEGINQVSAALKISKEQVDEITGSVLNETIAISTYLGVDIGDTEEMLVKANQEIWKTYFIIENLFKERQELTQNLLKEERAKGMVESQNIAMATLSHYLNNATMSISGRSELLRMMLSNNEHDKLIERLPDALDKIETSVRKIVAVIEEMKHVSPIDQEKFNNLSKAMNIDDLISARMKKLEESERKMLQTALED